MKTAIFDLDGTLADTSGDLLAAANACFDGAPLVPGQDDGLAFRGGRAMLAACYQRLGIAANAARLEADFLRFIAAYTAELDRYTTIYPGVEAALDRLAAEGWILGVCTNKPGLQAEELMKRLGLRDRFAALVAADTLPVRKPDPAPYREAVARAGGEISLSFLVGDTVTDRDTARAAGVPCVLVTFGPDGRGVADLEPEALLDHYDDLPELAARLID